MADNLDWYLNHRHADFRHGADNVMGAQMTKLLHVASYVAVALIASALTIALMVAVAYSWQPAPPYVQFTSPDASIGDVCAGQRVTQTVALRIREPAVLSTVVSVLDGDGEIVIPNAALFTTAAPIARDVVDEAPWTVPDLPPGQYQRVVGVTTPGRSSTPSFMVTHFSVVPCAK